MIVIITTITSTYTAIKQKLETITSLPTSEKEKILYIGNAEAPIRGRMIIIPAITTNISTPSIGCKIQENLTSKQIKIKYNNHTLTANPLKNCFGDVRDYALLLPQNYTNPQTMLQLTIYRRAPTSLLLSKLSGILDTLFNIWLLLAISVISLTTYIAKPQIKKAIKDDIYSIKTLFGKKYAEKITAIIPILMIILAIPTGLFIGHMTSSATSMLLATLGYPMIKPKLDPYLPFLLTILLTILTLLPCKN